MVSTHSVTLLSEGHAATGNSCIAEHEKRCPPIAHPRRCAPGAHGRPHYRTPWAHHGGHSSSARGQGSRPAGQRPMQATGQAVPCGHGLAYEARRTNARVPCALPRHRLRAAVVGLRNSVWTCELKRVVMSLWTAGGVSGRGPSCMLCCAHSKWTVPLAPLQLACAQRTSPATGQQQRPLPHRPTRSFRPLARPTAGSHAAGDRVPDERRPV